MAKKKPPGRPPLIETEIVTDDNRRLKISDAIIQALRAGAYVEDAAESVGIGKSTLYSWLSRGEEHRDSDTVPDRERPYAEFLVAVEKARAQAVVFNLATIRKAAQEGQWTAAAWWLERTRPEQFGRRDKIDHGAGIPTRPASVDLSGLSNAEVDELERLTKKAKESAVDG